MSDTRPPSAFPTADLSMINEEHVRRYRETGGEVGYMWNGAPILLLTTKGRKSGQPRTIAIIYAEHGDGYVIVGSNGGAATHPGWVFNIMEDPHVQVQIKGETFDSIARIATSPEREQAWAEAMKSWPRYDEYQSRTTRQIPAVVLERVRG